MNDFQVGDLVLTPGGYVGEVKEIDYTSAPIQYRVNTILETDQRTPKMSGNDVYYYGLQLTPWANSKEVLEQGRIVKSLWTSPNDRICVYKYKNQFYWVRKYNEEVMEHYQLR